MPIFDRFLEYQWVEQVLELAVRGEAPLSIPNWLKAQGLKNESARRTANILTRLWFPKDNNALTLRNDALRIFPLLALEERRALHWGMAIFVFPSFRQTVQICGRLLRIQSEFTKQDVVTRVLEQYSNQTTMKRSVERILQTLTDWKILQISEGTYKSCHLTKIERPELCGWLIRSLLGAVPEQYLAVSDLANASELFPFRLPRIEQTLHESPYFSLHRSAYGEEIVGISHPFRTAP